MSSQTKGKTAKQTAPRGSRETGVGIVKGNPKRCLSCHNPIRKGERWVKQTSPADPKYGSYSIIVHEDCTNR